jgi:hypothetical protein
LVATRSDGVLGNLGATTEDKKTLVGLGDLGDLGDLGNLGNLGNLGECDGTKLMNSVNGRILA